MASTFRHRVLVLAAAGVLLGSGTAVAAPDKTGPDKPSPGRAEPQQVRLVAAANSVVIDRWGDEPVYLDLGTHLVAGEDPLEIWASRDSYRDPIVAKQKVGRRFVELPDGLIDGFRGLDDFTQLTMTDESGRVVVDQNLDLCLNGQSVRSTPNAPDRSPYPYGCSANPFTLGAVWGLQAGWSTPVPDTWGDDGDSEVNLVDGEYTAVVEINEQFREAFDVPAESAVASVEVTVRTVDSCEGPEPEPRGCLQAQRKAAADADVRAPNPRPAADRPSGKSRIPRGGKPDLRSLPAWGIEMVEDFDGAEEVPGDYLGFAATVWVDGKSPLVVDGFREPGAEVMDAYQYFYDRNGEQVGYAPVGTMEWDARDGHDHWHFTDFAQYRLLDENKQIAVRSGKEAFCLANTDAIDYANPYANWRPEGTDLHTACGDRGSLAVREVLDVGSGDTYSQWTPGQSFDVTDLPNGTYYVEVVANPDGDLYEEKLDNNVSHRKIILGGEPGARTVEVPPYEGIDA